MTTTRTAWLCALALGASLPAAGASFTHENKPENLRALFSTIHQAVHGKKDAKQAAELMQTVMPDESRVKKALKDNVGADVLQRIVGFQMKYHLFYWDGKQWSMLGPVWRVLDAK